MDSEQIKNIISEWAQGLPLEKKSIVLFERVRDIPYGDIGSRDAFDVYKNNKGTCSGKHELLKEIYSELGIKTKDFIAMHKFNDMPVSFPPEIKEILNRTIITDPHNFFKILVNGNWVSVDVTWDKPLKRFGFPVNENWDGKTDMQICVVPTKIFEVSNPIESKKQKIAKFSEEVQIERKLFLKKMTEWLDKAR